VPSVMPADWCMLNSLESMKECTNRTSECFDLAEVGQPAPHRVLDPADPRSGRKPGWPPPLVYPMEVDSQSAAPGASLSTEECRRSDITQPRCVISMPSGECAQQSYPSTHLPSTNAPTVQSTLRINSAPPLRGAFNALAPACAQAAFQWQEHTDARATGTHILPQTSATPRPSPEPLTAMQLDKLPAVPAVAVPQHGCQQHRQLLAEHQTRVPPRQMGPRGHSAPGVRGTPRIGAASLTQGVVRANSSTLSAPADSHSLPRGSRVQAQERTVCHPPEPELRPGILTQALHQQPGPQQHLRVAQKQTQQQHHSVVTHPPLPPCTHQQHCPQNQPHEALLQHAPPWQHRPQVCWPRRSPSCPHSAHLHRSATQLHPHLAQLRQLPPQQQGHEQHVGNQSQRQWHTPLCPQNAAELRKRASGQETADCQPRPVHPAAPATSEAAAWRMLQSAQPAPAPHVATQAGSGCTSGTASTCPYASCPGIYTHCGKKLVRQTDSSRCEVWTCRHCDFFTYGVVQTPHAFVAFEILPPFPDTRHRPGVVASGAGSFAAQPVLLPQRKPSDGSTVTCPRSTVQESHAAALPTIEVSRCSSNSSPVPALAALRKGPGCSPSNRASHLPEWTAPLTATARQARASKPMLLVKPLATSRHAIERAGGVAKLLAHRGGVDLSAAVAVDVGAALFHLSDYEALRQKLHAAQLLDPAQSLVPSWVLDSFRGQVGRVADVEVEAALQRMPPELRASLMPFQLEGVRFGLECGCRCLIGDEMGAHPHPCLCCCPFFLLPCSSLRHVASSPQQSLACQDSLLVTRVIKQQTGIPQCAPLVFAASVGSEQFRWGLCTHPSNDTLLGRFGLDWHANSILHACCVERQHAHSVLTLV
jgi:hypothetical protein